MNILSTSLTICLFLLCKVHCYGFFNETCILSATTPGMLKGKAYGAPAYQIKASCKKYDGSSIGAEINVAQCIHQDSSKKLAALTSADVIISKDSSLFNCDTCLIGSQDLKSVEALHLTCECSTVTSSFYIGTSS